MSKNELAIARVNKATDAKKVSPIDLLETIIDDIQKERSSPDALIIIELKKPENGNWEITRSRSGLDRAEETNLLWIALYQATRNWLDG